jgi:SAM-dependent methyltransferase
MPAPCSEDAAIEAMKRSIARLLWRLGLARPAWALRQFLWRFKPRALVNTLRYAVRGAADGQPMPRMWARVRVAGSPDPDWFFASGSLAAGSIRRAVADAGRDMAQMERILDFGCGCGRVLRHWKDLTAVHVCGSDFQVPLLRECQRILPFVRLAANGAEPPLPFADASFDLIYCLSVFTHFDERQEPLWRDEIRRVLKPGGLWVFSVQGQAYVPKLTAGERRDFDAGRMVCQRSEYRGLNLCMAFHPEPYVRRALAEGFTVVGFTPQGALGNPPQDLYVLRSLTPASPETTARQQVRTAAVEEARAAGEGLVAVPRR